MLESNKRIGVRVNYPKLGGQKGTVTEDVKYVNDSRPIRVAFDNLNRKSVKTKFNPSELEVLDEDDNVIFIEGGKEWEEP